MHNWMNTLNRVLSIIENHLWMVCDVVLVEVVDNVAQQTDLGHREEVVQLLHPDLLCNRLYEIRFIATRNTILLLLLKPGSVSEVHNCHCIS